MTDYGESSYRRFLQEDPHALEELLRTYADPLVRFAYQYVKNAHDAEDIMADAFAALFLKAKPFRDEKHLRAYLYKLVRNKSIDHLRRNKNHVSLEDVENVLQSSDAQADMFRQERNRRIYICMQALPEQYRAVLQLKYFDGFSPEDICRILGKSPKQVYNLLARARIALKELLEKEGITHEDIF